MSSGSRRPRVLVLSHMYPSKENPAAGVFIHRHVQALQAAGLAVRVVAPVPYAPRVLWYNPAWRAFGRIPRHEVWEGVTIDRVPYLQVPLAAVQPYSGYLMARPLVKALRRLRGDFPFDLVHSHTVTPDGLAALHLRKVFAVPVVNSARGSDLNEYPHTHPRRMEFTCRVLLESDRTLAVSQALADVGSGLTGGRAVPEVVYNGVDQAIFRPAVDVHKARVEAGIAVEGRVLLFVGRCELDKGVGELLEAFHSIRGRFPGWRLLCVGEGGYRNTLLRHVAEMGLEGCVSAPGAIPHGKVAQLMKAADAFVLPSWGEGMPNVLLEAMACGLPCVATSVGGIPEVLAEGRNGWVVPPRDPAALAVSLAGLMESDARARAYGTNALETIQHRFSWENNARFHLALYEDMISRWNTGRTGGRT